MKGFGNMMKQAQAMQARMAQMQEELAAMQIEGTSGGGMVRVVTNGKQEVLSIKINPEVVDPEDVDMLEDLILAALAEAREKSTKAMEEAMARVTGGLGLPPGLL